MELKGEKAIFKWKSNWMKMRRGGRERQKGGLKKIPWNKFMTLLISDMRYSVSPLFLIFQTTTTQFFADLDLDLGKQKARKKNFALRLKNTESYI